MVVLHAALSVKTVDLCEKENAKLHRTDGYELVTMDPPTPVLRRGQLFKLKLRFNRPFVKESDIVRIFFSFGSRPDVMRGTNGIVTVDDKTSFLANSETWQVRVTDMRSENVSLEVQSPADSPVGVWKMRIDTTVSGVEKTVNTYEVDSDIYLLFNPWVKDDLVYMDDEKLLEEYVMNDTGKIWLGTEKQHSGRGWVFGQFEDCVLPACELMLKRSEIKDAARGDPIKMSRAISRIINANDDGGVLVGRWDSKYDGGVSPSTWTGSVPILKKFLETKESVLWGQCWVFSGVATTVCRALGLPARSVTNLTSAHDGDNTLSIDRYFNSHYEYLYEDPITGKQFDDMVWNFHVWNEVWMARPDLPMGYGGWQAIDATPQEQSDGMYQCGPASIEAIRQGAVGFNYDIPFMVSTVNADVIHWIEDRRSESGWRKISCSKSEVGRMILTKAPFVFDPNGDGDREDITFHYKAREGTREERFALYRAARSLNGARKIYAIPEKAEEDCEFTLVDLDTVNIGEPFSLEVNIKNYSHEPRTFHANLTIRSVYYNGNPGNMVRAVTTRFTVSPHEREVLRLPVTADQYLEKLVEYCHMKLSAVINVVETNQTWVGEDDFRVVKPTIAIEIAKTLIVGKPADISLKFENPLKELLTDCKLNFDSSRFIKTKEMRLRDVAPGETVQAKYQVIPHKTGKHNLVVTFVSKQLCDISGMATVEVINELENLTQ
ncbi:hemocyte protein-glutamine gamma-glutamyltransferase-like [Neodiprion pinetum]|uniref:hemocyte protein-glutamine gamma-glutamyltransferase-like n=1 Tax=Neodiprion pinetum TaxID=441929 RepID=UPI001EE0647A|nr:hemocyte protein-glutamine gamma-glutamyltransferase-like [Neodiprion pinetum]